MTPGIKRLFLRRLRDGWKEDAACRAAGVSPPRLYAARDRDSRFRRQYQKAYDAGTRAAHARIEDDMRREEGS